VRVLLDECLPARLKRELPGHAVSTVPEVGWRSSKDSQLLRFADKNFDVFVTIDQGMERENDLSAFRLGFVVASVRSNRLIDFQPILADLAAAIARVKPGEVVHIDAPGMSRR